MVLLRGVFWLSLVAAVVPYSKIDRPNASFAVDRTALMNRLSSLPHFCRDNGAICAKAEALAGLIGADSLALAGDIAQRLHAQVTPTRL